MECHRRARSQLRRADLKRGVLFILSGLRPGLFSINLESDMKVQCAHGILLAIFLTAGGIAQAGPCTGEIDQLQQLLSKSNAQLEPNGKVATDPSSPAAVQQQNEGQGTASAATPAAKPASLNVRTAQESLTKARTLDQAGQEQACQDEVAKAKAAFGAQ
jgi:hypothetical protein